VSSATAAVSRARQRVSMTAVRVLGGPVWFPILAFLAVRVVDAVFFVLGSDHQIPLGHGSIEGLFVFSEKPADPGYAGVVTNWDGQWYQAIATNGYQVVAPGDSAEVVRDKAHGWAFPPLYPLLVAAVMHTSGVSFVVAASAVSLVAGACAHVMLFHLIDRSGGRALARAAVLLLSTSVSAPLFQAAYSEAVALALLLAVFLLMRRHAYWWALVALVALSFARLITPVLAIVVAAHAWQRYRSTGLSSISVRDRLAMVALAGYAIAGAIVWPTLAAHLMGELGRFNRAGVAAREFSFGWFTAAGHKLGLTSILLVPAIMLLLIVAARDPRHRGWGLELRVWSVCYPLFVFAATSLNSGILRYALLSPVLSLLVVGDPTAGRSRRHFVVVVVLAALVGLWLHWLYVRYVVVISSPHPLVV